MKQITLILILSVAFSLSAEEVSIVLKGKTLGGELDRASSNVVAFFISGSGPTDRDGNTAGAPGKNNCIKYLSEFINKGGISTLRVDKRGIGASASAGGKEIDLRFSTYVDDVGHWISFLEKEGFTEVVLVGHSEGALVATLAAKNKSVIGLVSTAGAGRPAPDILREQLKPKLPKDLFEQANNVVSNLARGKVVEDFPPSLTTLFRPSVQPYLISWFKIDPAKAISELRIPVLIVQGSTDLQSSIEDAKLLHAAATNSEMKIIEGMNHILKEANGNLTAQLPSYFNPNLPLHKDLGTVILQFIKTTQAKKKDGPNR